MHLDNYQSFSPIDSQLDSLKRNFKFKIVFKTIQLWISCWKTLIIIKMHGIYVKIIEAQKARLC